MSDCEKPCNSCPCVGCAKFASWTAEIDAEMTRLGWPAPDCSTCPDRERLRRIEEALRLLAETPSGVIDGPFSHHAGRAYYIAEDNDESREAETPADALLAWAAARKGEGR